MGSGLNVILDGGWMDWEWRRGGMGMRSRWNGGEVEWE